MNTIYSKQFIKSFTPLEKKLQLRIRKAIGKLPDGDVKKLKGNYSPALFRLRVGKHRILFEINEPTIFIVDIDTRGDIYKGI